jgi:hypothetical protein
MVRQGIMLTNPPPDTSGPSDEPEHRHLTPEQREDIAVSLQDCAKGQVSMTAAPSDEEAVSFEGEIAEVLEDAGFDVEIDNLKGKSPDEAPPGVQATIADQTVRPRHAYRVVQAFRRVGVAIATRINEKRRRKNTLYIAVGPNDTEPTASGLSAWQAKTMKGVIAKWKARFAAGLHGHGGTHNPTPKIETVERVADPTERQP